MRSKQMGNSRRRGPDDPEQAERNTGIEDDRQLQDERFAGSAEDQDSGRRASSDQEPVLSEGEEVAQWSEDEDQDELSAGSDSEQEDEALEAGSSPSSSRTRRDDDDL